MLQEFLRLQPHQLAMLVPFAGMLTAVVIATVALTSHQWRRAREAEIQATLKSQMLEQGMSADDIERVLAAGSAKRMKKWRKDFACDHKAKSVV